MTVTWATYRLIAAAAPAWLTGDTTLTAWTATAGGQCCQCGTGADRPQALAWLDRAMLRDLTGTDRPRTTYIQPALLEAAAALSHGRSWQWRRTASGLVLAYALIAEARRP